MISLLEHIYTCLHHFANYSMDHTFTGGVNIAIKIPKSKYDATLTFYRDVLHFEVEERPINNPTISRTCRMTFGGNTLWLDCVDNYTHSETWLELNTPDVAGATEYLATQAFTPAMNWRQYPNRHTGSWIRQVRCLS